jgi:DNA repair protein RecN (Recombination protein N)
MLRHLDIRDILIIDRLDLAFQPGLNVLTGETGAGKSILLDALGFVLGWRGRADLVRHGAKQAEVTAVFELPDTHPVQTILHDAGLPCSSELILRRVNVPDGRKTAWINDRRASGDVLRALSDVLVELHGQQDDKGLLNPKIHRDMLDDFGGHRALLAGVSKAWADMRQANADLNAAQDKLTAMQVEEDFLRHAVGELDALSPQPGEEETLDARRRLMQAAEKMRQDIARASQAIGPDGAEGAMNDARRWLETVSDKAEGGLETALMALERALVELSDAQSGVEHFADQLDFNPAELEEIEDRLFEIRGLSRKHGVTPDELPGLADSFREKLSLLDGGTGHIAALAAAKDKAQTAYETAANGLSAARQTAAARLDALMAKELAPLKMERAVFTTTLTPAPAGPHGVDAVTFTAATNPGAPSGPLNKIASGGELSRFLLALKVCLTREQNDITMIFDEIDRGVGGATADAVGRRLSGLADGGQVLVVTHSPQVAALGQHHWRVSKSVKDGATLSRVSPLSPEDRVDEVARMISGDTITDAARAAAQSLLAGRGP